MNNTNNNKHNLFLMGLHISFIFVTYILFLWPVIKEINIFPAHDNLSRHLVNYLYFSNSLLHGFGFPHWYPFEGGVPVGVTSVQLFSFLPHRLLGYAFYIFLPVEPVTAYKMNLISGMLIFSIGWWFFLYSYTQSRISATFGVLMILLGGTGITILHQEQILATITWIPWILLAITNLRKNYKFVYVLAILVGFSMTVHYPQIQVIFLIFLIFALAITGKYYDIYSRIKKKRPINIILLLLVAFVLFISAASPIFYVNKMKENYSSPLRESENIQVKTFEDYIKLNNQQLSSVTMHYLKNYIKPRQVTTFIDQSIFYVSTIGIIFGIVGLFFNFNLAFPVLIILFLSIWAALGINGFFAQILYLIKFPFIEYFRQWYHFSPIINLCLSALGALGLSSVWSFLLKIKNNKNKKLIHVFLGCIIVIVFSTVYYEGRRYLDSYIEKHFNQKYSKMIKYRKDEFLKYINDESRKNGILSCTPPLVTDINWYRYNNVFENDTYRTPFITNIYYNDSHLAPEIKKGLFKIFCNAKFPQYAVFATIPKSKIKEQKINLYEINDINNFKNGSQLNMFNIIDDIIQNGNIIYTPDKNIAQWINSSKISIKGVNKKILFEHPPARIEFPIKIPMRSLLEFSVGLVPDAWSPKMGDGVLFEIYIKTDFEEKKLFSKYIDPKNKESDRKWHDFSVNLNEYADKNVVLVFVTSPGTNNIYDWSVWGNLSIITPSILITKENIIQQEDYTYTPKGGYLNGISNADCLIVFPLSYLLKLEIFLNHQITPTYPVFNGAMTGIIVPKGKFRIDLHVPISDYQIELLMQIILIISCIVIYVKNRK